MYVKKNSGKKLIILLAALILILGISIGGTIAWLATSTGPLANTFTTGNVDITLTEPNYVGDANGVAKLMPGGTVTKDPTVTILAGSEPCYVRMFMVLRWSDAADGWYGGTDAEEWFDFNMDDFQFV